MSMRIWTLGKDENLPEGSSILGFLSLSPRFATLATCSFGASPNSLSMHRFLILAMIMIIFCSQIVSTSMLAPQEHAGTEWTKRSGPSFIVPGTGTPPSGNPPSLSPPAPIAFGPPSPPTPIPPISSPCSNTPLGCYSPSSPSNSSQVNILSEIVVSWANCSTPISWNLTASTNYCVWTSPDVTCDSSGNITGITSSAIGVPCLFGSIIPDAIGELTSLLNLELDSCGLVGSIPDTIVALTNLKTLLLGHNRLNSTIPPLSDVPSLLALDLSHNSLNGAIPSSIASQTNLTRLMLNDNQLSGIIPAQFILLTHLIDLQVSQNRLTGPLPDLSALVNLIQFNVSNNHLNGTLPSWISNFPNLMTLQFSNNAFSGQLPPSWASTLVEIWGYSNSFSGTIPDQLSQLNHVTYLDLGNNDISGTLNAAFFEMPKLNTLGFHNNLLNGSLPSFTVTNTSMARLWLFNNSFTGSIPDSITDLEPLKQLLLYNNQFGGVVPDLSPLSRLEIVNLACNQLSGTLPVTFTAYNFPNLTTLNFSNNALSGPLPDVFSIPTLQTLDLSANLFSGGLPADFFLRDIPWTSLQLDQNMITICVPDFSTFQPDPSTLSPLSKLWTGNGSSYCNLTSILPSCGSTCLSLWTATGCAFDADSVTLCSCSGSPPALSFICSSNGIWVSNGTVSAPNITVQGPTTITGNLTVASIVLTGSNSTVMVDGCANITSVQIVLTQPDIDGILNGSSSKTHTLVTQNVSCSFSISSIPVSLTAPPPSSCQTVSSSSDSSNPSQLAVVFNVNSSSCGQASDWWIILICVLGGVLLLAFIIGLVLYRRGVWLKAMADKQLELEGKHTT